MGLLRRSWKRGGCGARGGNCLFTGDVRAFLFAMGTVQEVIQGRKMGKQGRQEEVQGDGSQSFCQRKACSR